MNPFLLKYLTQVQVCFSTILKRFVWITSALEKVDSARNQIVYFSETSVLRGTQGFVSETTDFWYTKWSEKQYNHKYLYNAGQNAWTSFVDQERTNEHTDPLEEIAQPGARRTVSTMGVEEEQKTDWWAL